MSAAPESTLLHYRLLEKLGEGGMGVVWKAADTTLDREVAIKILPDTFAREAERLARFEREAKTLAALSHPGIAAVYGLHEDQGIRFLAMELAPGEELFRVLKRGALPLDEALKIAVEIARALEAAHEVGVVHRDLKPSNIMVAPGGGVKVLDFGLAKTFEVDPASGGGSMSPTLTTPATRAGVVMGTAAYMSPEQARGKPVDKRADIWAFGVVLWEMLTGRRAFQGETVSDTLASVLKESPDLGALPSSTPAAVRRLIARCLEKDPRQRLRDIGEARILLSGDLHAEIPEASEDFPSPGSTSRTAPAALTVAGTALAALAAGVLSSWLLLGDRVPQGPSLHLSIPVPEEWPMGTRLSRPVAISPAGDRVIYVSMSGGSSKLFSRMMGSTEFEAIPGSENCVDPFFSPDGRSLGFLKQPDFSAQVIDLDAPVRPTNLESSFFVGAVWGDDGFIYYTPSTIDDEVTTSIHRIPAGGGAAEPITEVEAGSDEIHIWPEVLPGGAALIYAVVRKFDFAAAELHIRDLASGEDRLLIAEAQLARYVSSGHLIYLQGNALLASRFDPDRMELLGGPRAVLDGVMTNPDSGSAAFALSREGTLVYVPGTPASSRSAVYGYDREGHARPLIADPADYTHVRLSPDGSRIAVVVQEGPGQTAIRVHDIRRRTVSRLSNLEGGFLSAPRWTPDGRWIYYQRYQSASASQIMQVPADGSAPPEVFRSFTGFTAPSDFSPDGRWLLYSEIRQGGADLHLLSMEDPETIRPYLATEFNEGSARISPNGRFAVYVDDSMGRSEVFIRSFPEPGGAWRISTSGGQGPAWSPDGREVFYVRGLDVMAVAVGAGIEPEPEPPRKLFTLEKGYSRAGTQEFSVEVHPDGSLVLPLASGESNRPSRIDVITNWFGRLGKLVP